MKNVCARDSMAVIPGVRFPMRSGGTYQTLKAIMRDNPLGILPRFDQPPIVMV